MSDVLDMFSQISSCGVFSVHRMKLRMCLWLFGPGLANVCSSQLGGERYFYKWWIACGVGAWESAVTWPAIMENEEGGVLKKIS